jgi:serine/threonine-protein kinase/endoribonuclease IRE1
MLRRPPGEGRLVAEQRRTKVLLALAIFVLPWLTLADAQQQHHRPSLEHQQPAVANVFHASSKPPESRLRAREDDGHEAPPTGNRAQLKSPFEDQRAAAKLAATVSHDPVAAKGTPANLDDDDHYHDHDAVTTSHTGGRATPNQRLPLDPKYNYHPHDASALATVAPGYPVRASKSPRQPSSVLVGAGLSSPQSARSLERWTMEDYVLLATVDGHLYAVTKETGDRRWHLEVEQPTVETIHHRPNHSLFESHDAHPLDDYLWAVEPTHTGPVYVWMPSGVGSGLVSTGFTMKQLVDELGPYAVQHPPVVYTGDKKTTMYFLDAATGSVLRWIGQGEHQVAPVSTCFQPKGFVDTDSNECSDTGTIALSRTEYTVNIHRQDDGRPIATLRYFEWGPNSFDNDLHRQYRSTPDNRYLTSRHDGMLYALDDNSKKEETFSAGFPAPVARVFDVARPQDVPRGSNPELVLLPQPSPPVPNVESAKARGSSVYLNKTDAGGWYALSGNAYPLIVDAPAAKANSREWLDLGDIPDALMEEALVGTHALGNLREDHPREVSQWPSLPPGLPPGSNPIRDGNASVAVRDDESDLASLVGRVRLFPDYAAARALELVTNPLVFLGAIIWLYWYLKLRRVHGEELERRGTMLSSEQSEPSKPVRAEVQVAEEEPIKTESAPEVKEELYAKMEVANPPGTEAALLAAESPGPLESLQPAAQPNGESPEKRKKKAHRGTRGGVKHKKKKPEGSQNSDGKPTTDVDPVTQVSQMMKAQEPQLNPNIKSIGKPDDIGVGGFEINGLRVNLDEQLGMGSNGTVVFPGTFYGRDIAVKRMLHEFNDLATRETDLLLESDNHPNGMLKELSLDVKILI